MPVVSIAEIAGRDGEEATVRGWLYQKRSSGKIQFLVVRDGTGYLQVVLPRAEVPEETWQAAESLGQESSLTVTGRVRRDPRSPGGVEMTGRESWIHADWEGEKLIAAGDVPVGAEVDLAIDPARILRFDRATGDRLTQR